MNKILVVDDDPHFRELVKVVLQTEGFAVQEAADGLDLCRRPRPREFWSLNILLWALLLFVVKKFLWARLPFGNRFISRVVHALFSNADSQLFYLGS